MLVAGAAFTSLLGPTSGPEVLLFYKRFKKQWEFINHSQFTTGTDHEVVAKIINPIRQSIMRFAEDQLDQQPRDDYRELLELSIIFLGGIPPRGIHFMKPGAMHHARWMSKIIYSLKVWIFREQFKLTRNEEKGIREFCLFFLTISDHFCDHLH